MRKVPVMIFFDEFESFEKVVNSASKSRMKTMMEGKSVRWTECRTRPSDSSVNTRVY